MYVGDTVRHTTTATVARPRNQPKSNTRDRTRSLADSAATLLDRMKQPYAHGAIATPPADGACSAMCQWVVELTYRMMPCTYVGIALVRDDTLAIDPVAEAGTPTGDRQRWWAHVRDTVFIERAARIADAPLIETPLIIQLPSHQTASSRPAQPRHTVCAVPINVGGKLTAIFGSEAHGSQAAPTLEMMTLTRAMASMVAITLEDIALKRSQAAQETAVLRTALDEMDGALSWVSHELRAPLATIKGSIQLIKTKVEHLARQVPPDAAGRDKTLATIQERLAMADRYTEIESRLASDLVDASRIRSAQMTLRRLRCDLGQLVRESVDSQRFASSSSLAPHIIHLEVPDCDIPVSADPDRIEQVIGNLLGNAVKYSPKDMPVEVCVEVIKTYAKVSVRDSGPGLDKSDLTRVWKRFYRVNGIPEHNATGSGLGLGLYIARDVVRRHGGKVGVLSAPGCGATFWFTLPLVAPA